MTVSSDTYAALLRAALRNNNWSIRDLENQIKTAATSKTGGKTYSYEHIRKIISGLPVMSEHFNEIVCDVLGLDKAAMWQSALQAKSRSGSRSAMIASSMAASAPTEDLRAAWAELTPDDCARATRFIEGLAEQRKAERLESTSEDPEVIRDAIIRLTQRLTNTAASGSRRSQQRREEGERQTKTRIAGKR